MSGDPGGSPFGGAETGGTVRVLHVDDEPGFADLAGTHLERASDRLAVDTAGSAQAGLDRLREGSYDCVVSDYDMPGTDGLEFLAAVREEHPDLPFVLFTGKGSEAIASRAISAGVTDYIQKGTGSDQYAVLANRIEHAVDRARTERALASNRRRLSLFVEQSPLGVIEWNDDFEVTAANPAARTILGYDEAELVGRSWEAIVPPDERESVGETVDQLLAGTRGLTSRNENVTKSGERIICEWHNRVVTDDGGEVVAVFSQFQDVTAREEYRRRLETLISNLPGMAYRCRNEPEWPMEFVAGECEDLTGYPAEAIEEGGEVVWGEDVLHPEDRERAWETVQAAVEGREPFELEYRIRCADGETRWMWERGRGIYGADGALEALEGFMTDVTDRVEKERELSETNTVLSTLLENLPVGVLVEDSDREILAVNGRLPEVLGMDADAEALEGADCRAALAEVSERFVDPEAFRERTGRLLEEREPVHGETHHLADGRVLERSYVPYALPDGEASLWLYREVTEREGYRRRLETLIDNLPGMVYRCRNEPGWPMEFVTGESEALTGYDPATIEAGEVQWGEDVIHPEDRQRVWDEVQDAVEAEEPFELTYRIRTADGERRWVWERGRAVDGGSSLEGFITDVTERERRERSLQGLQRRTRELMYTTSEAETAGVAVDAAREVLGAQLAGVLLVDASGERLEPVAVDDALADLVGELPVFERGGDDPVEDIIWTALETGEALTVEDTAADERMAGEMPVRSGIVHPLGDHGVLVVSATEPGAFDDTDRALVEILATTLTAALDRTDRESLLRERERELERENDRLDAFASAVSHDLRNPLNVAAGNVDLALDEHDDEVLHEAAAALERMDGLVEDLLTLARKGDSVGDRRPVDVGTVARECTGRVATDETSVDVDADVTVDADRSRLAQLIENLLANAVEHGGESVTVGVLEDGTGFYVADDGPGIPPEDRDRVFEAGYTTGDGGAGLGLSIVRDVVEGHGWSLSVAESEAGGARIEVRTAE